MDLNPFQLAVEALIKAKESRQKELLKFLDKESFSPVAWARDFNTIHCSIGRRSGKTSYIKHKATEHDLIVVESAPIAQMLKQEYDMKDLNIKVISGIKKGNQKYKTIFVDEPKLVFGNGEKSLEEFYVATAHGYDQLFIFLGE